MKILIVDDHVDTKCVGIMEECKKRQIEVKIARASKEAICIIYSDEGKTIDGMVLDMNLPLFPYSNDIREREGENLLRELSKKELYISTLVFSETQMSVNYIQVFDQMTDWNKEHNKFDEFIEKLEDDKERQRILEIEQLEIERLKREQMEKEQLI